MKNILVCGAGGFIGNHLVKKLKEEGCWVRGVDLKYPEFAVTEADDFVIGGSISNAWEFFEKRLVENLHKNINDAPREHVQVNKASLGDNTGLLGAAALLF